MGNYEKRQKYGANLKTFSFYIEKTTLPFTGQLGRLVNEKYGLEDKYCMLLF